MNLTDSQRDTVLKLVRKRDGHESAIEHINSQLERIQSDCSHPAIKGLSGDKGKRLVIDLQGRCPDCQKQILAKKIIKLLKGQY